MVQPAKRKNRVLSIAENPSTSNADACACDHHGNNDKPDLPWLPKRVRFSGTKSDLPGQAKAKTIPSLMPLNLPTGGGTPTNGGITATVTSQTCSSTGNDNGAVNAETLRAQIRLNTQMMSTIEQLRNEIDQLKKERNFFQLKLTSASDQIMYLKKKVNKNGQDENINPNMNATDRSNNHDNNNESQHNDQ